MGTKKVSENDFSDVNDYSEVESSELEELNSFDQQLQEWIDIESAGVSPKVYLYRFDNFNSGNEKSLVYKYEGMDIPDAHDVGLQFGSGRYLILATIPAKKGEKSKVKGFRFKINTSYDSMRLSGGNTPNLNPLPIYNSIPQNNGKNNGLNEGLTVIKDVMALFMPLITLSLQKSNNTQQLPDLSGFMMKQYSTMSEVMKHNLIESSKTIAEAQRYRLENIGNDDSTDESESEESGSMIEKMLPLIEQFLPLLVGNNPAASATIATVKKLPEFKKVVQNKGEINKLIAYLDQKEGKEVTDTLLKKFKISR